MRAVYLVGYDICNPKRLKRVHKVTKRYGERLQYSLYLCRLDDKRLKKLKASLSKELEFDQDQIVFIRLGMESNLKNLAFSTIGLPISISERTAVIV